MVKSLFLLGISFVFSFIVSGQNNRLDSLSVYCVVNKVDTFYSPLSALEIEEGCVLYYRRLNFTNLGLRGETGVIWESVEKRDFLITAGCFKNGTRIGAWTFYSDVTRLSFCYSRWVEQEVFYKEDTIQIQHGFFRDAELNYIKDSSIVYGRIRNRDSEEWVEFKCENESCRFWFEDDETFIYEKPQGDLEFYILDAQSANLRTQLRFKEK